MPMLSKALAKRMLAAERSADMRWAQRPGARCPWAWTERFVAYSPRHATLLDRIVEIVKVEAPALVREKSPRIHGGTVVQCLVPKTLFMSHEHAARHAVTQDELDAAALWVRYMTLRRAYEKATRDFFPTWRNDPKYFKGKFAPPPLPPREPVDPQKIRFVTEPWWPPLLARLNALEDQA